MTAKPEPIRDEPAKGEPAKGEPAKDEPAKDEPTEVVGTTPTPASDPFDLESAARSELRRERRRQEVADDCSGAQAKPAGIHPRPSGAGVPR